MDELKANFLKVVKENYANFNGRARRKEYWQFVLVNVIISVITNILTVVSDKLMFVGVIVSLALLLPSLAVAVRRLHDVNKSGWYLLIALVPIVGGLYLLYLMTVEGDKGANQYGADPKGLENLDPFADQRDTQNPFTNS